MGKRSRDIRGCPFEHPEPGVWDRRAFVQRVLVLTLGAPSAAAVLAGCGGEPGMDSRMPEGMGSQPPNAGWMMSRGAMDARMTRDMRVIHDLLVEHDNIRRSVENIPGGIRSSTTSTSDRLAELIQTHVWQMKARIEDGDAIRQMDPLFREIFEHHRAIRMRIENIDGGVRVTETSRDPQVTLLIRQHAHRAVSQFAAAGMSRAMRPTPLPPGYRE